MYQKFRNTSSQIKLMMLTDAGPRSLHVRIILETLLQLFNNFQCHTQINLRYRQSSQCRPIIFNILGYPEIV